MNVPVRWVLAQPELALELKAGAAGLGREISFALTTELPEPFPWLSGGELVLTTGIRLPSTGPDRARYLAGLDQAGVAAVGFGTGLSHPSVPADLVTAADELGLPLFEVPLPTPFTAVAKRVMRRLAEQEYESVLRASRAQPKMTRAVVDGGPGATVRELAVATESTAALLDLGGRVLECWPKRPGPEVLAEVQQLLDAGTGEASSRVSVASSGAAISVQRITVGSVVHGYLAVSSPAALSPVDQILLGHANSLLALDFEKPARLRAAQNRLNSHALGLLLAEEGDLTPAWSQVAQAGDAQGEVRALTVLGDTQDGTAKVAAAVEEAMNKTGRQLFVHRRAGHVTVLLRGSDDLEYCGGLLRGLGSPTRRSIRAGLSGPYPVERLVEAIDQSTLAASAAEPGGEPLEFTSLTGSALLSFRPSREVLNAVAKAMIAPLAEFDRKHGTELISSLRAFLEANGHWESAAARLGVHRHTLRSRIVRVQSLLDCDLDVARVRAELLLAIIAWQS